MAASVRVSLRCMGFSVGEGESLSDLGEAARPPQGRTGPNRAAGRLGQAAVAGGRLAKPGKAHAATEDPPQPQALPLLQGPGIPRPEPNGSNPAEREPWWPGGRVVGNCPIQTVRLRGVILPWR